MLLPQRKDLALILSGHYIFNVVLSLLFLCTRGVRPICPYIFWYEEHECEIDSREREILFFLAIIIVWKGRKAANWQHYLSNVFMFSKLANFTLFFRADPVLGIVFGLLCLVQMVIFPEPAYNGPDNVVYFQGPELFEELSKNRNTVWVIEFYASWHATCRHIAPVFAQLCERFTLPNMRFGKLDVGRWPNEANRFYVNAAATSRQLPTICVFKNAKEVVRRPIVKDQRAVPFTFTEDNCILDLDLMNLYAECKQKAPKAQPTKKTD